MRFNFHTIPHSHFLISVFMPTPLFPSSARKTPQGHKVIHVPEPICDTSGHCRTHAKCTMNFDEVVGEII